MAANDKEIWKQVTHLKASTSKRYAVSNKARLASYDNKIDDRYILKQHLNGGFPMVSVDLEIDCVVVIRARLIPALTLPMSWINSLDRGFADSPGRFSW